MADSPFREQRFRTEEVRQIVRSALARDAEAGGGRAFTRDELTTLLTDLGASPEVAARAIDEAAASATPPAELEWSWLGGPRRILFEVELDGELADERREDVVELIRDTMNDPGRVEVLGRTVTWAPTPAVNNQQRRLGVKLRVRDGKTLVRIEEDMNPARLGAWLGLGSVGAFGLGTLAIAAGKVAGSAFVGVAVWALITFVFLAAAWGLTRAITVRRRRELGSLFEKVREEVIRGAAPRDALRSPPRARPAARRIAAADLRAGADRRDLSAPDDDPLAEEEAADEEALSAGDARPRRG